MLAVWPRQPVHAADDDYPLLLNTGRVRDHWHTMTRTGRAPKLAGHRSIPELELHPQDALLHGIRNGELTRVASRWGSAVLRARVNPDQARRQVFAPIHWNDQTASDATIGRVVNPDVDPLSGEPEFKHTPVRVTPFVVDWSGFVLLRNSSTTEDADQHVTSALGAQWWTRITVAGGTLLHIAGWGRRSASEWSQRAHAWYHECAGNDDSAPATNGQWLEASDDAQNWFRAVQHADRNTHAQPLFQAAVFVAPTASELPSPDWLSQQFSKPDPDVHRIAWLMAGQHSARVDAGNTVCACFAVGERTILAAIADALQAGQPCTTADLGARLRCGTNCGSCLPELRRLIAQRTASG